jgi:hypothetical protein
MALKMPMGFRKRFETSEDGGGKDKNCWEPMGVAHDSAIFWCRSKTDRFCDSKWRGFRPIALHVIGFHSSASVWQLSSWTDNAA